MHIKQINLDLCPEQCRVGPFEGIGLGKPSNSILNKAWEPCFWFIVCSSQVRLSTGTDLRLSASMADTIGLLKKQLQAQEDIDAAHQRWFFSGKLLTDKTRLQDTKI